MLDLIVNPIAGGKKGKKILKWLSAVQKRLDERNICYATHFAEKIGQTTTLTKSLIDNGATDIVVLGGDGTLHAAINGFHSFEKVNLGIIPCGTGNDFASSLNIPLDPVKAIDLIIDGTPKYTDFMQMPTVRGLNVIGVGIDVDVLKRYNALNKKTKFGYTSCLIKSLFKFDFINFKAHVDQKESKHHSFIAVVANGKTFGGGIPICPVANPTDKQLDFVAVEGMNKLAIVFTFIKLKLGKILKAKQTTHKKGTIFKVDTELPCSVNVDGELYENIPFEVEIVSDKLKVYRQ